MIEIIPIKPDEIAIVQSIARNTWAETFDEEMPLKQIEYMYESMYSEESLKKQMEEMGHQFILAWNENKPVGFASYEINYQSKPQTMIHKIFILTESQKMGVGKKMINHIISIARDNANNMLRHKVYKGNRNAIGFYEKIGFGNEGSEVTDHGNDFLIIDYVMIKNI